MKFTYHRAQIVVKSTGGIITDSTIDHLPEAQTALNATGLDYVHEYYWPGDNWYVFVRIPQGESKKLLLLLPIAEKVTTLPESEKSHRGRTMIEEFANKKTKG